MATGGDVHLTDTEIEELARVIITKHMASIAIKDLGIPQETVENRKLIRQGDYVAFNRDLLSLWRNKNPGINQVQVSQKIPITLAVIFLLLLRTITQMMIPNDSTKSV